MMYTNTMAANSSASKYFEDLEDDVEGDTYAEQCKVQYEQEVEQITLTSQHASFFEDYAQMSARISELGSFDDNYESAANDTEANAYLSNVTNAFNKLWSQYATSAMFHPPYTIMPEQPPIAPVKLRDNLSTFFKVRIGSGANAISYEPIIFTKTPRGLVKDLVDVESIRGQYVEVYGDVAAGSKACFSALKKYFKAEKVARKAFQDAELALAKAKYQQRLLMEQSLDTGEVPTEDEVIENFNSIESPAVTDSIDVADMLSAQQQIDAAQNEKEIMKLKARFLQETRNAFNELAQVKQLRRKKNIFLRDHDRKTNYKLEQIYLRYTQATNSREEMAAIAQNMQETKDEAETKKKEYMKQYNEAIEVMQERYLRQENPVLEPPGALERASASDGAAALRTIAGEGENTGIDVDESNEFAGGAVASTVDANGEKQWRLGRRSTRQQKRMRKGLSKYREAFEKRQKSREQKSSAAVKRRRDAEALEREAKEIEKRTIEEKMTRCRDKIALYQRIIENPEDGDEQLEAIYHEELEKYEKRLRKLQRKLDRIDVELSSMEAPSTMENNPEGNGGASGASRSRKKQRRKAVPKPPAERLTASFGTTMEVIPLTPPAVAEVTSAAPEAVIKPKKKRGRRKKKKSGLTTETTIEPGKLVF